MSIFGVVKYLVHRLPPSNKPFARLKFICPLSLNWTHYFNLRNLESGGALHNSDFKGFFSMQQDFPSELKKEPLPLERFGIRAQGVLQRLGIKTLSAFWNANWDTIQCWQLGTKVRDELKSHQEAMGLTPEEWQNWLNPQPPCDGIATGSVLPPSYYVPDAWRDAPLRIEDLTMRVKGILHRLDLTTLGAFLTANFDVLQCRQLGATARAELSSKQSEQKQWLEEVLQSADPAAALENYLAPPSTSPDLPLLPRDDEITQLDTGCVDLPLLWMLSVRSILDSASESKSSPYEVLSRRFDLDGYGKYSLEAIGLALKVTRERVRQREVAGIEKLRAFVSDVPMRTLKVQIHPALKTEVENLKNALETIGFPLPDAWLWDLLAERYDKSLTPQTRPFVDLLLDVMELSAYRLTPGEVIRPLKPIWLDSDAERPIIVAIANAAMNQLRGDASPLSLFDLLVLANRDLKDRKLHGTDEVTLRRVLDLCPLIEAIGEDVYQCRFADLTTNVLRVERIMREWSAQGKIKVSINELRRELNHRLAIAGKDANLSHGSVSGPCGRSSKLVSIGKSGWMLKENASDARVLHEVIEEALLVSNRPSTVDEITEYVTTRRSAGSTSIPSVLAEQDKFQRVGRGLYALRSWGLADAPPTKRGEEFQREFDEALLEVFLEHDVRPILVAELAHLLVDRLSWKLVSVRQRLENSPWIDIESAGTSRLIASWRDTPKDEPDPAIRQTKQGQVQGIARRLLREAPEHQMLGATLSALIERETFFVRPLIYSMLAKMPDVLREGKPGHMIYILNDAP